MNVETGAELLTSKPAFHAGDTEQVADYRTVSALAIISLVFGLASPLCMAWPLLMTIPLVGAAISIIALRRIDASDGALVGRWAATTGLMLSVASIAAAVSRDYATRYVRTRQAEVVARDWVELLLAGNMEEAFRRTIAGNRREPPPEPGMPAPTKTPFEQFGEDPVVSELAAAGADAEIQSAEILGYDEQPRRQFFVKQKFRVTPRAAGGESHRQSIEVVLTLQRSHLPRDPQPRWLVLTYETPQAAEEAAHVH